MKRAGKVFLALTLVLAMLWTSTGTSNVPGVLAENVASMQSAKDNKEAVKATTEETTTETKEKSTTASKAEQETTAKKEETTTQEAATEAETKKEEAATREKKAESTTAAKKKTAKSKIATQDAAEAATKGSDSNSSNQNIARAAKIDIAKCITAVDMSVTINGKKTALDDLPAGTLVPRGAPVSIIVKYDNVDHALENLGEGTVLYYQLPEQIEIVADQQGDLTEEGKVVGKFTISKKGLVEITFTEGYLTDCGGKIEQGSFWINGNFNKEFGGKGQETIIFGPVKKTIHFDPKLEEDKTNLNVTKKITGFDAKTQKLTYTITVTAPADNTQTVKDVKVTDVFADNSLKMLENLYKDINASKGTFDAKTGIWTIGDMEKGEIQTLTYSVKIKNSWDDTITDKTISNTATVTAGTEKKAEVTSNKVFNNNLNITKSTVDGTYGTSKGIHVDATGTWIKYTITVNASNVNQDDASGVKVTDVFSDDKEDIEQYYAIEGATQTNSTEPGAGEIYIDNNKKDFIWNIGTMKPGETKTLTYCVKLKDSVWENSGNTSDTVKKKFTNKATLTATGMEEDKSATTTVNLKKKWISKKGEWDAATGKMKFTVQANKGDNNSPVLDRNFTFTDKMTGDYAYTGNLVIEAKNASGKTQWTDIISLDDSDKQTLEHGTFTWNTDGGWTYKAAQAGEFVYYLTYYAKPTANGHNHISNTASIGINGSSYEHKTNWSGTGSEEIALTKEYVSGVTAGKMKWRTTIPVRVVEGSAYVDTISSPKNHKFVSEDKLREGLDIYFGQESNKLKEGKDYTLTYNDDYKFTITFLHEIDADSTNRIVITYYTENTVARDDAKYKDGDKFTYTNAGKLTIREGQELSVSDSTVWYKHSSISKEAGDYDKTNRTIRWFITLNKDGTLGTLDGENSVAAITPAISTKDGQSTLTFSLKAGHKAKVSGLPVGTYNVTENAASRSETDKTAYTASYSVDGNSVSNVKVKVAQDADSNAVPNVTVTNTYKTELKVLKKDIGTDAPLSGAQLAIYNNSDVTFDSEGKATVKAGATAVASWTSGTDAKDLTGKVVAGGNYVLVETAVPTSDYVQAAAIPFKVDAEGQIQVADAYANNYNDSTHTITLNNQKKTGSLTVKKIIEDGEADTAFDFTVTFTNFNNGKGGDVTVTRKGKEGKDQPETKTVKPDADGSLKLELKALTNNEAVKISGIPYGTSYTVTETQQEGYLETANSNLTGIIGDNGTAANGVERATDAEASITNTRLTGFTVKKLAEYGQYTPDAETKDNKQFKFKVTLTRNDAVYTRKFTIKYSDKEQSEEVRATNGVYEFTLKDTQSAAFSDLPSGTKYTVEEVADDDYDASVKVNNTVQNADNNKNVAATAEGTIDKTGDTVEFTNTRKLGAFSFTKTVKGNMQDKEQSYDFYVEVDGKPFNGNAAITQKDTEKSDDSDTQDKTKEDKSENTAGTTVQITDGKLSLTDGQTATIANIPAGVSYSIKETTGDRYVTLIDNKVTAETAGTVEEGKTTETQFVNQVIHLNITKTDLTGEREVAGAAMTLYKAEDVNEDGTVKDGAEALDSWVSGKESFHDFGPAIKAGESYVLVETAAPDGYTYAENISFTVNVDGTIKTDAEKTTDKETGEDVYLVKDDVTKVSIKKMDITGNNEVAGARLLLKDKEGNVIESWMSATEAHVFEQKLIAGETYTLAEVTAPSGYEVAADITFTVNKDGTVSIDGKAVDGNEIIMKDDTTPVGEEGKLVVSKLVTFQGKNQAVNRTFYVALFSDADCTQKVSNVKELKCEGAWSAYTVFEHLKDGTYYVAETDEDGNKLESSEACKIEGNGTKCEITPTQKTAYAVIENQLLIPEDDFLNTLHNLTVTKNVTLDGEQISEKYSGTFYVSLFTDPYYTNRTGDVKELQIQNGKSTSVSFTDLADGTYYVAETDKDGNPVENTDFGFDVSYDGDITVSFTEQNTDSTLAITNDMTERNPEYKKYSKKEDDGDDGKEKKKTSTSKNNSSNKTTKKGKNSKTGDNSHILFYAALAAAALAAGSAEVYRRRRRATGRNKHDR